MNDLSLKFASLSSQFSSLDATIQANSDTNSAMFKKQIADLRAKVYGGCAACVVFPPSCIACYGIAAGVLEGKCIPDLKKEAAAMVAESTQVIGYMNSFATQATTLQKGVTAESKNLGKFSKSMTTEFNSFSTFENDLEKGFNVNALFILINNHLADTKQACDTILSQIPHADEEAEEPTFKINDIEDDSQCSSIVSADSNDTNSMCTNMSSDQCFYVMPTIHHGDCNSNGYTVQCLVTNEKVTNYNGCVESEELCTKVFKGKVTGACWNDNLIFIMI